MKQCECLRGCPFFNDKMDNMPSMAEMYKQKYCLGSPDNCARYVVFKKLGKSAVPLDLFPNQLDQAKKLLK